MFSLGLDFSLRKLIKVAPTAGIVAVIQCSFMLWVGYLVARLFGWTVYEALFAGAALSISSTTIIVKAFADAKIKGPLAEIVFGVLIVEDLIAIVLITILTAVASGAGLSASALALTVGKLAGFLAVLLVGGMLIVPRLMRAVVRLHSNETTVVAAVGLSFAFALLARWMGYSVALGAFLAGALIAESGAAKIIEQRIEPVRDVFAAVFFVSIGMLINPYLVWQNLRPGAGADGGRRGRQPHRRVHRDIHRRLRRAHVGAGGDEPQPDRRVLVHHRRRRPVAGGDPPVSLSGRGRGVGADDAADAVADPLFGARRRVRRPPAAAHDADVRVAVRRLGERPARDARTPDGLGAHPPPGLVAGRRRRAAGGDRHRRVAVPAAAAAARQ